MTASVRLLTTGGTIASTADEDGAVPTRSGTELRKEIQKSATDAEITVEEVTQILSFAITPADIAEIGQHVLNAISDGQDGIVVTHGTDTMAVSAYYLDVALDPETPVVFTGAQRRSDEYSPDGPANLWTAVSAATDNTVSAGGGVYIAFNDELHAARDVVKSHTHKLETFQSPGKGPVALFGPDGPRFHREPRSRSTHIPTLKTEKTVDVIRSGVGIGGDQLRQRLDAVDGIVLEGTGLGNVTPKLSTAVDQALHRGIPVVLTTRCHAGGVNGVYGTDGGGKQLLKKGVIPAGDLPASKARVKLLLALEHEQQPDDVKDHFHPENAT